VQPDPVLSVVVAVVSDTVRPADGVHLCPCLQALVQQVDPPPFEIIVPHHPHLAGITELRRDFPHVRFLEIRDLQRYAGGGREHHNELRARGVAAARGNIVALIEDHGLADPHWCARIVEAHKDSAAGIGGAIENGVDRVLNWAVYFCDFGQYQNPAQAIIETSALSDANVSYKRSALESIRSVWREVFHEGAINHALATRGERLLLSPDMIVYQNRLHLDLRTALAERWVWGRSYGADRNLAGLSRFIWGGLSLAVPFLILTRLTANTLHNKQRLGPFCRVLPVTAVLVVAWCLGEMTAYIRGERKNRAIYSEPALAALPPNPRLSVVIVRTSDEWDAANTFGLAATLDALEHQSPPPFEVILPCSGMAQASHLRQRYPRVLFLPAEPASPRHSGERLDELRAIGVAAAQGDIIAVTEDHVRPDPDWSARILEAHQNGYAAVGGAIENSTDHLLNWATYFADLGRYHNPLPAGESGYASVVNVSYKREALKSIRAVWNERFSETAVHAALLASGEKLALSGAIIVRQYRDDVQFGSSLRDFFIWGRSYGSTRSRLAGTARRLMYVCLSPLIPAVLLLRSARDVFRKRRLVAAWLKSLPIALLLTLAWSAGELMGYVAGEASLLQQPHVRQTHAGD
jgi:hypothetical protein